MFTRYNPRKHGRMTTKERHVRNKRLWESIPKITPEEQADRLKYIAEMEHGPSESAEQYKAGYEIARAKSLKKKEIAEQMLFTKRELKRMNAAENAIYMDIRLLTGPGSYYNNVFDAIADRLDERMQHGFK